jgi:tetratricopeptide (TPR) repeat protein
VTEVPALLLFLFITPLPFFLPFSGDVSRAEETYLRVITGQTETLGLDHPDTLLSMNNLANLLSDIGKLSEAEEMYTQSLAGQRRTIGDDHEETIGEMISLPPSLPLPFTSLDHSVSGTKYNLGILYHQLNRLEEAEKYALEAYTNYCSRFGIDHANTLSACYNVAVVKRAQGRFVEAEFYYRQTLSGQQLYLGLDHEDTLKTMSNLAILLQQKGELNLFLSLSLCLCFSPHTDDHREAEDLYLKLISALENKPSSAENSELLIDLLARYGDLLFEKDNYLVAQEVFEKLMVCLEKKRLEEDEETHSGCRDNGRSPRSEGEGEGDEASVGSGGHRSPYLEIWIETKEKLDLVREVNSTDEQS